jgi:hypothetical protein
MKKAALLFLSSTIVAAVVASLVLSHNANQAYCVEIVEFNWTSSWGPGPVGLLWGRGFNVTLHNLGDGDIEGVKMEVKLLANNSEIWSQTWLDEVTIEGHVVSHPNVTFGLHAGEIREFDGGFVTKLDELDKAQGEMVFRVIVLSNSTILDDLSFPST